MLIQKHRLKVDLISKGSLNRARNVDLGCSGSLNRARNVAQGTKWLRSCKSREAALSKLQAAIRCHRARGSGRMLRIEIVVLVESENEAQQ